MGGTPIYQPFLDAIFPNKNHPDMGYPHGYGNPHMEHINWYITYSVFTGTTPLFGGVHRHGGTQIASNSWMFMMETNFHTYTSYPLYSPILSNFIAPPTPYEWSPADEGGPLVAFT